MLMNRRTMLTYSMASVALTLTGCKKANTTIVVYNRTNLNMDGSPSDAGDKLSVDAEVDADGRIFRFRKRRIPVGKSAQQKYSVKGAAKGDSFPFIINELLLGSDPLDIGDVELEVVVGYKNVFVVYYDGAERIAPDLDA